MDKLYLDRNIVGAKISVLFEFDKDDATRRVEICETVNKKIFETLCELRCDVCHIERSYMNEYMIREECEKWEK